MAKQSQHHGRAWYVLHTYSGYEDNVARNLRQRIDSMDMQDLIFDVMVPIEKKIKIKSGKRNIIEEKIYPGYVLVDMVMDEDSWYIVRNTPRVTGFVGAEGTKPTPLSKEEIDALMARMAPEEATFKIDYQIDEIVKIVDGPFKDCEGKVSNVDQEKGTIKVMVPIFGRETPVELDPLQVKKL